MNSTDITLRDITNLAKKEIVPVSILVETNYTCIENCIHCFLNNHYEKGLTVKEYDNIFKQMVSCGTLFVIFTGGEPFLRTDFIEIVAIARKHHLSVTIFTNGILLDDKTIRKLKNLNVHEVHVSLYAANESVHDKITKLPGSFHKTLTSIQKLVNAGIRTRIKCPLMKYNIGEKEQLKKFAQGLGIEIQFSLIITAKNNGDLSPHDLRMSQKDIQFALQDKDIEHRSKKAKELKMHLNCFPCDVIFNGGAIDPSGNVFVCNQLRIVGGNLLITPLKEIWEKSENFQKLRSITLKELYQCKKCHLFSYCTRCPGLSLLEDKDLYGCSSVARKIAKIRKNLGIFPNAAHIFSNP